MSKRRPVPRPVPPAAVVGGMTVRGRGGRRAGLALAAALAVTLVPATALAAPADTPATAAQAAVQGPKAVQGGQVVHWSAPNPNGSSGDLPPGGIGDAIDITGNHSAAALTSDGEVKWWNHGKPLDVPEEAKSGVTAIAEATGLLVGVKDGRVYEWGDKANPDAIPEEARSGVTAVSTSGPTRYAIANGKLITWGFEPPEIPSWLPDNLVAFAAGSPKVVLTKQGRVIDWSNLGGKVPKEAQSDVVRVAGGGTYRMALKRNGDLITWGELQNHNEMGLDRPEDTYHGIKDIVTDGDAAIVINSKGELRIWGDDAVRFRDGLPEDAGYTRIAIARAPAFGLALKGGPLREDPTSPGTDPTPDPSESEKPDPTPDPGESDPQAPPAPSASASTGGGSTGGGGHSGGAAGNGENTGTGGSGMDNAAASRPTGGDLAATGAGQPWLLAGIGAVLLAAGGAVVYAIRRKGTLPQK